LIRIAVELPKSRPFDRMNHPKIFEEFQEIYEWLLLDKMSIFWSFLRLNIPIEKG